MASATAACASTSAAARARLPRHSRPTCTISSPPPASVSPAHPLRRFRRRSLGWCRPWWD
jgi:hypothetical protein